MLKSDGQHGQRSRRVNRKKAFQGHFEENIAKTLEAMEIAFMVLASEQG